MATASVVRFGRLLRERGFSVVPDTAADMLSALNAVDVARSDDVRAALKAVTVTNPQQSALFDQCFDAFFADAQMPPEEGDEVDDDDEVLRVESWTIRSPSVGDDEDVDEEVSDQVGASSMRRFASRDFSDMDDGELERARRLVANMQWQPSSVKSRRWAADNTGVRPDMRRTLRRSVGPRGDLLELAMSDRRLRRRPLIVIADVSGSMEAYAEMMLTFAHAARARIQRVETFAFSTHLTRITWELSRRNVRDALSKVSGAVDDWSGGTKIGEAIATFNRTWSRRVCRGGPVLLIVSDGWDCGDPALLRQEMARLSRSVHRVVWLNPLAGRPGYAPETRGMQAVLPYVDDFLPAANLIDLREVVDLLESIG
jgi:uncharacterized protein with von Willebrand factor type A (vWA) domain